MFRFVLLGRLEGAAVLALRHAWSTASSVIGRRALVVDLESLLSADQAGMELLSGMRDAGARFIPSASPIAQLALSDTRGRC